MLKIVVKSTTIFLLVSKQKFRTITCKFRQTYVHRGTDLYPDTHVPRKTGFKLSLGFKISTPEQDISSSVTLLLKEVVVKVHVGARN